MKLNLGCGDQLIAGYENLDGKLGHSLWPIHGVDDGSVEEVRASHVLEHFARKDILDVLREWVRVLKPGGVLRVAVPDFALIAKQYISGARIPVQGYVMGGQTDDADFHKSLFDYETLSGLLREAGLIGIRRWHSEIQDCAALPISLNLCGTKPHAEWPKVAAVLSVPRLGFNDFWACAYQELSALRIPLRKVTGAYWDSVLTTAIEESVVDHDPEWILTCDYDSIFTRDQVLSLLDLAMRYPHADAIAPLQVSRGHEKPMFTVRGLDGELIQNISREDLTRGEVIRSETAHFGMTLIRVSALRKMPRPWFFRTWDENGGSGEGAKDPDVNFWLKWKETGNTLYVALRVPIGHADLNIRWPDINFQATFQSPSEFFKDGAPENLWR